MKSIIASTAARFSEPSSYAGLTGLLALIHVTADGGLLKSCTLIAAGVCGVVAYFLPETKPAS